MSSKVIAALRWCSATSWLTRIFPAWAYAAMRDAVVTPTAL